MNRSWCPMAVVATCTPAMALAGGLARPNLISARGVGLGGAFTAVADDPSALHFNPAGAAWADAVIMLGVELVYAPRSYTPVDADGNRGPAQEASPLVPVPVLGVLVRFADEQGVPSRLTFGAGIWNTHGGSLEYDRQDRTIPAVNETTDMVVELAAGVAYDVNDMLAIGAALRVGLGIFHADTTARPADANLSGTGVGLGATLGVLFRPTPAVTLGASWRSPLTIQTRGEGTLELGSAVDVDTEHEQPWPQAASLGIAVRPTPPLRISAQVDWTGWSSWETLELHFSDLPDLNRDLPQDWSNNVSVRAGVEYALSPRLAVRGGGYFDSNAVPDRTIERIFLDNDKLGVSAGSSVSVGSDWRIDVAADAVIPNSRDVPYNRGEIGAWDARANLEPGEHEGGIYTLELAVARRL